jgi:hypothetical protein
MKSKTKAQPKTASPPMASGIPVHCSFTRIMPASELDPHPKNAHRKHPPKQLDRFGAVIKGRGKKPGNGWRRAIVVSLLSGRIIRGHGAYLWAKRENLDVPVEFQSYANEKEELRDLVADNKLSELAENDDAALARLLSELGDELAMTGFDDTELERMLRESDEPEAEFPITAKLGERHDYCVIFTDNETDFLYLQNLIGLTQEKSYKQNAVGLGRAIPFSRFIEALRANRHTLDVSGGKHDNAPAHPGSADLRPGKPERGVRTPTGKRPAKVRG